VNLHVAIVDLGIGNIRSLSAALAFLAAEHTVTSSPTALASATHIILPGVGAFDAAMRRVADLDLGGPLQQCAMDAGKPILGVCLGMQLLLEGSEEGMLPGLGLARGWARRLVPSRTDRLKVPHVGFAQVYGYEAAGLFAEMGPRSDFYFTHSYALHDVGPATNLAFCDHSRPFVAAFEMGRICGVQFHPEKSQSTGLVLLANFLTIS
jgi:imidazole glycerol-phosphate synthase subunit HisH